MKSKIMNFGGLEYEVFEDGRIFGVASGQEIKQRLDEDGYPSFTCGYWKNRSRMRVHKAMALAFLDKPFDYDECIYDVDHFDDNRQNNHISNLSYMKHTENVKKAYSRGNHEGTKVGEKNGRAVHTEEDVIKIRHMYDSGVTVTNIIKEFHPDYNYEQRRKIWGTFDSICKRKSWKHIK